MSVASCRFRLASVAVLAVAFSATARAEAFDEYTDVWGNVWGPGLVHEYATSDGLVSEHVSTPGYETWPPGLHLVEARSEVPSFYQHQKTRTEEPVSTPWGPGVRSYADQWVEKFDFAGTPTHFGLNQSVTLQRGGEVTRAITPTGLIRGNGSSQRALLGVAMVTVGEGRSLVGRGEVRQERTVGEGGERTAFTLTVRKSLESPYGPLEQSDYADSLTEQVSTADLGGGSVLRTTTTIRYVTRSHPGAELEEYLSISEVQDRLQDGEVVERGTPAGFEHDPVGLKASADAYLHASAEDLRTRCGRLRSDALLARPDAAELFDVPLCTLAEFAPEWMPAAGAPADTTPPTLDLPAEVIVRAQGEDGAVVTYEAAAQDDVDGPLAVACVPASGTLFPIGDTTVRCSATDAAGNVAEASFTVTVRPTIERLVRGLGLTGGLERALLGKLEAFRAAVVRGNTTAAAGMLQAFVHQVRALSGKSITPGDAAELLAEVDALLAEL